MGEKYDEWRKVLKQEVQIVVGARSAIFAPFKDIGVIIIDEEHEATYKQEEAPRYHAIEVAKWRATVHRCYPVPRVFCSCTKGGLSFADPFATCGFFSNFTYRKACRYETKCKRGSVNFK